MNTNIMKNTTKNNKIWKSRFKKKTVELLVNKTKKTTPDLVPKNYEKFILIKMSC